MESLRSKCQRKSRMDLVKRGITRPRYLYRFYRLSHSPPRCPQTMLSTPQTRYETVLSYCPFLCISLFSWEVTDGKRECSPCDFESVFRNESRFHMASTWWDRTTGINWKLSSFLGVRGNRGGGSSERRSCGTVGGRVGSQWPNLGG